jgi:hypothetical protein
MSWADLLWPFRPTDLKSRNFKKHQRGICRVFLTGASGLLSADLAETADRRSPEMAN